MSARYSVVLVGSGRMGAAFGAALEASRAEFVKLAGRALTSPTKRVKRPAGRVLWLLAVSDRFVGTSAEALARKRLLARGDAVVHMAGMLGLEPLGPVVASGASRASMHPLVAVASPADPPPLRGSALLVEAEPAALPPLRALARKLRVALVEGEPADRSHYHAAAALVATGAVALAQAARPLFLGAVAALGEHDAAEMIASLLRSVAHNVAAVGPEAALASPLMRGDVAAVERHLAAMSHHPPARAIYAAALAQALETLAHERAVEPSVIRRARALLARAP